MIKEIFGRTRRKLTLSLYLWRTFLRLRSTLPPQKPAIERSSPSPTSRSTPRKDLQWRLIPLELSPPRFTWPPRSSLAIWDYRVRRLTSPFYKPPQPLSPILLSSRRPDRVTKGTQCQPVVISRSGAVRRSLGKHDKEVQCNHDTDTRRATSSAVKDATNSKTF